jgi:hypothetical protein
MEGMTDAKQRSSMRDKSLPVGVRDAVEEVLPSLDAHDSDMEQLLITAEKMKKNLNNQNNESAKRTEGAAALSGQSYVL